MTHRPYKAYTWYDAFLQTPPARTRRTTANARIAEGRDVEFLVNWVTMAERASYREEVPVTRFVATDVLRLSRDRDIELAMRLNSPGWGR